MKLLSLLLLGACSTLGIPEAPKERYKWIQGPVVHPVTGKNCSVGYCESEPVPEGKSGCHSDKYKDNCPFKK